MVGSFLQFCFCAEERNVSATLGTLTVPNSKRRAPSAFPAEAPVSEAVREESPTFGLRHSMGHAVLLDEKNCRSPCDCSRLIWFTSVTVSRLECRWHPDLPFNHHLVGTELAKNNNTLAIGFLMLEGETPTADARIIHLRLAFLTLENIEATDLMRGPTCHRLR